jgi:hypothetical protein
MIARSDAGLPRLALAGVAMELQPGLSAGIACRDFDLTEY